MREPVIKKEHAVELLNKKFIKVFDLNYAEGKHYFDATRRDRDDIIAVKTPEELSKALPDAVSCFLIIETPGEEPRLLTCEEYRYPIGRYVMGVPAGLMDRRDFDEPEPVIATMKREIKEETGLDVKEGDRIFELTHMAFMTPGFTDENNAVVCAVIHLDDTSALTQTGAEGTELFNGFHLLTAADAERILESGKDDNGVYLPFITWSAILYFLSNRWKENK